MIEKEFKYLITKEAFEDIKKKLETFEYKDKKEIVQTNYYYDTNDLYLHKNSCTLRVREKDGKLSRQLKARKTNSDGYVVSSESKMDIQGIPYAITSKEIKMSEVNCEFRLLGSLTTFRTRYAFDNNVLVDCDVSTYMQFTDYEIEIEFSGDPPEFIQELFKDREINSVSKYKRFLTRWNCNKEIQNE